MDFNSTSEFIPRNKENIEKRYYIENGETYPFINGDLLSLVGARILRRIRKRMNVTQGKAAEFSEISQSYFSNVEQAKHNLSMLKYLHIFTGIGFSYQDGLFAFSEEMTNMIQFREYFLNNRKQFNEYESFSDYIRNHLDDELFA